MSELTQELSRLAGQWIVEENVFIVPAQPGPNVQLTTQNPTRWALVLAAAAQTGTLVIVTALPGGNNAAVNGYQLNVGAPLILSYRDVGGLVQAAWFAIPQLNVYDVVVTEVLLQQ